MPELVRTEDPEEGRPARVNNRFWPSVGQRRLQESEQNLRRAVEALRTEVASLQERMEAVEGRAAPGRGRADDHVNAGGVDADDDGRRQRSVSLPRRVFPELITEAEDLGDKWVYGAAVGPVVEWREAWTKRQAARQTLA